MVRGVFDGTFAGRSVFVTGHTGFKGSWLCLWLERLGARVTGYALEPPTEPANFAVSQVAGSLERDHRADVRDDARLLAALREARPDVVFHLAAQTVVGAGYDAPRETFDVNVMGTVSLLEAIRRLERPCAVVVVTSDKCYENRESVWGYREDDPLGDHDPYGGSKGAAEIVVRTYRHSYFQPERLQRHGVKLASARAGNVIGGGDWTPRALVVDVVQALAAGRPVDIRCPDAFRPWQHVLQALSGYLTLAARMLGSDDPALMSGWNIGPLPGGELPVRDVVAWLLDAWGGGSWRDVSDPEQPREATVLRLCIDKALWQLGWRPGWSVEQALTETARWYRRYQEDPGAMHDVCLEQIAAYEQRLAEVMPAGGRAA
jgi:CDP-glucose 4,6-dehydratase